MIHENFNQNQKNFKKKILHLIYVKKTVDDYLKIHSQDIYIHIYQKPRRSIHLIILLPFNVFLWICCKKYFS